MQRWLMAAAICLCAVPGLAQDKDADGSKDHPTDLPRKVEGRYWKISY